MLNDLNHLKMTSKEAYLNKEKYIFLDVRTPEIYEKATLDGFQNICVYEVSFLENIQKTFLDKSTKLITFNQKKSSIEGSVAAKKLREIGYSNVFVIDGDIDDLINAGFKLSGEKTLLTEQLVINDGSYSYDMGTVSWTGRNANGKHYGNVAVKRANIEILDGEFSGEIVMDMNKISNEDLQDESYNQLLVDHLKSDDFFNVSKYPEASFSIRKGKIKNGATCSNENLELIGKLEITGIGKQIAVDTTIVQSEDKLILETHFSFDRTLWNIVYGSAKFFSFLGMHMIFDPVSIEARIEFKKQ